MEKLKEELRKGTREAIVRLDALMKLKGMYQKDILAVLGVNSNEVSILRKRYRMPIRRYKKDISTLAKICATGVILQGLLSKETIANTLGVSISVINVWIRNREHLLEVHRNELLQEG